MPLKTHGFCAVRKVDGQPALDLSSISHTAEGVRGIAEETNHAQGQRWVENNPVERFTRVNVIECVGAGVGEDTTEAYRLEQLIWAASVAVRALTRLEEVPMAGKDEDVVDDALGRLIVALERYPAEVAHNNELQAEADRLSKSPRGS